MAGTTQQIYGIKSLRRIQLAKEAAAGTQLIATTVWRGEGTMQDDTNVVLPPEDLGVMMDTDRAYIPFQGGTLTLSAVPATFEQLPYLGEMGIMAVATGTQDGAGSGYIYSYLIPTTAQRSINTYSTETGDNADCRFAPYALCESIKIAGKYDGAVTMEGVLKARTVARNLYTSTTIAFTTIKTITDSSSGLAVFTAGMRVKVNGSSANNTTIFTCTTSSSASMGTVETAALEAAGSSISLEQTFTSVAIPAVKTMNFNQSKLYIDDTTIGNTQVTGTFLGFEWAYKTGWKGQTAGDGRLDFSFSKSTLPSGTLKITFENENTAKLERAKWLAGTPRLIRIKNEGPTLTTAGSSYSKYTMLLDCVGVYTKFNAYSNDKEDDTVVAELTLRYDTTAASAGQLVLVNQLTALT
jgi:hypothetical protein